MSPRKAPGAAPPTGRPRGFTFLEVMMALSMLVVGSVAVLTLFAVGADQLVERRVDARMRQIRPEVDALVQQTLDRTPPDKAPESFQGRPLSQRDYTMDVDYRLSAAGPGRWLALVRIRFRGTVVRTLPPIPLSRSVLSEG